MLISGVISRFGDSFVNSRGANEVPSTWRKHLQKELMLTFLQSGSNCPVGVMSSDASLCQVGHLFDSFLLHALFLPRFLMCIHSPLTRICSLGAEIATPNRVPSFFLHLPESSCHHKSVYNGKRAYLFI